MLWIEQAGQLPPRDAMFLVYAPSADPDKPLIMTAWWNEDLQRWDFISEYWGKAVTHWMELPEPPASAIMSRRALS